MTLRQQQSKFVKLVGLLIQWAYQEGYELTFGEAKRSQEQQDIYIKQGLSKTKNSKHLTGLAIDIFLFVNGEYKENTADYKPLGDYWKTLDPDCVWGGDWAWDGNHFQLGE